MFNKIIYLAFIWMSLTTILSAADFWQKKKYSEWSPKEVQSMLNNSPWAKRVEVVINNPRSQEPGGGRGRPPSPSSVGSGRGGSTGRDTDSVPRATLIIRMHSALPIKQAIARATYGDEVLKSPEAAKTLGRMEDAYIVGITGSPRLLAAEVDQLKQQAQLVIKGKAPIQAENAMVEREKGGLKIFLVFPRTSNPIKIEDESVELQVKFSDYQLKQRFKLKEMVFEGNLEF